MKCSEEVSKMCMQAILDNIIEHQKNKNALPKEPLFEDFDENFKEKLKKHDQFMQRINTRSMQR